MLNITLGARAPRNSLGYLLPFILFATLYLHTCEQDPYLVVNWGGQEARTSAKRDSGKDCSWPREELALIVRTKKQLQEPVEVEVSEPPSSSAHHTYLFR